jgi:hypothetical protein
MSFYSRNKQKALISENGYKGFFEQDKACCGEEKKGFFNKVFNFFTGKNRVFTSECCAFTPIVCKLSTEHLLFTAIEFQSLLDSAGGMSLTYSTNDTFGSPSEVMIIGDTVSILEYFEAIKEFCAQQGMNYIFMFEQVGPNIEFWLEAECNVFNPNAEIDCDFAKAGGLTITKTFLGFS